MLANLDPLELGRLRLSVGYGTHKKGRPLSPIEVGSYLKRARDMGASLNECAKEIQLRGTGHIGRFLRILGLPHDLHHLITWGKKEGGIGFSTAVELGLLENADDQRAVADAILKDRLTSREVRQISQIRVRSRRPIGECLKEVIGMRPVTEQRYVFIGLISDQKTKKVLANLTQAKRDAILTAGIQHLQLNVASGRLGSHIFTVVGGSDFGVKLRNIGKERLEGKIRSYIQKAMK